MVFPRKVAGALHLCPALHVLHPHGAAEEFCPRHGGARCGAGDGPRDAGGGGTQVKMDGNFRWFKRAKTGSSRDFIGFHRIDWFFIGFHRISWDLLSLMMNLNTEFC